MFQLQQQLRFLQGGTDGSFTYDAANFSVTPATENLAMDSRFGHSTDITVLFGGATKSEQEEYIQGLLILGILSASISILWIFFILLFCMCGHKRVGFLSGQRFQRTQYFISNNNNNNNTNPNSTIEFNNNTTTNSNNNNTNEKIDEANNADNPSEDEIKRNQSGAFRSSSNQFGINTSTDGGGKCCGKDQATWVRLIFIGSGIIYIVMSILLVTEGLTNIQQSIDTVGTSTYQIMNLTGEANSIVVTTQRQLDESLTALIPVLEEDLQPESICPNNPMNNISMDEIQNILDGADQARAAISSLDAIVKSDVFFEVSDALLATQKNAEDINSVANNIDVTGSEGVLFTIFNTIIVSSLIVSATLAMYESTNATLQCIVMWVLFPLFIVLVLLSAILSAGSVMAASGNSDYCFPTLYRDDAQNLNNFLVSDDVRSSSRVHFNAPDVSSLQLLQQSGIDINSQEYRIALFYMTQCTALNPFDGIDTLAGLLEFVEGTLTELIIDFKSEEILQAISNVCGREYDDLLTVLENGEDLVLGLKQSFSDLIQIIRCKTIVPIYQDLVYDTACGYSIKALTWIFSTSFIMSFFGFLMIAFRAAYSETVYTYKYDTNFGRSGNSVASADESQRDDAFDTTSVSDEQPKHTSPPPPMVASSSKDDIVEEYGDSRRSVEN